MHEFERKAKFIALEGTGKNGKSELETLIESRINLLVIVILEDNLDL